MQKEFNFLEEFSVEDYTKFRERVISMVLATDMSLHFSELGKIKSKLAIECILFLYQS